MRELGVYCLTMQQCTMVTVVTTCIEVWICHLIMDCRLSKIDPLNKIGHLMNMIT